MKHVQLLPLLLFPSLACSQPDAPSGLPSDVPTRADVERHLNTLLFVEGSFRVQLMVKGERPVLWIANAMGIPEIIVNAVEHGNLGITCEEKTRPERGTCNR